MFCEEQLINVPVVKLHCAFETTLYVCTNLDSALHFWTLLWHWCLILGLTRPGLATPGKTPLRYNNYTYAYMSPFQVLESGTQKPSDD